MITVAAPSTLKTYQFIICNTRVPATPRFVAGSKGTLFAAPCAFVYPGIGPLYKKAGSLCHGAQTHVDDTDRVSGFSVQVSVFRFQVSGLRSIQSN